MMISTRGSTTELTRSEEIEHSREADAYETKKATTIYISYGRGGRVEYVIETATRNPASGERKRKEVFIYLFNLMYLS